MQNTLEKSFSLQGTSLHRGEPVTITVGPAPEDSGITFVRTDLFGKDSYIKAIYSSVSETSLCTKITNAQGVSVQTVEHLMAAFAGTGIHNANVKVSGPELPILDGSSRVFVQKILECGKKTQRAPIMVYKIKKDVVVENRYAWARLSPSENLSIEFKIDYSDTIIGKQKLALSMKNGTFVRELCDSRTFCRQSEISLMKKRGLAKGGTLSNAVVLGSTKVENSEGLRRLDECVRHKMLDAMGDLSLAGRPIIAAFSSSCGGHTLTNKLLRQVFSDPEAFCSTRVNKRQAVTLPGFGLKDSDLRNLV